MSQKDNIKRYWKRNFSSPEVVGQGTDLQKNIARTKNGVVVDPAIWSDTIDYLADRLELSASSVVLELCCGNGVVLGELAPRVKRVIGVDYSQLLLEQLEVSYPYPNVETVHSDVMDFQIESGAFDAIVIYFSIQHFDERETFMLVDKCIEGLKGGGKLFIGDIPDEGQKWDYIDRPEYRRDYFQRLIDNRPKIGNWFSRSFFSAMGSCYDDADLEVISQPPYQINSEHCFDVLITKKA